MQTVFFSIKTNLTNATETSHIIAKDNLFIFPKITGIFNDAIDH